MSFQERWPNLIIAGVHKAGTTSLFTYLSKHPDICASRIKEIGYYMPLRDGKALAPPETYLQHFMHCGTQPYRMEASPSYLYGGEVIAGAIQSHSPDARIILILREPVERLSSFYHHIRSKALKDGSSGISDFIRASMERSSSNDQDYFARGVREGEYAGYLEPWLRIYGDNLKIVYFDALRENPRALCNELTAWLGLNPLPELPNLFTVENKTLYARNPMLHKAALKVNKRLEGFFRNHHALKRSIRKLYYTINSARDTQQGIEMDQESTDLLKTHYMAHNSELRKLLQQYGRNGLPSWLNTPHVRS
ncbi:MAG: sulfotransferase domain-containing protein [Bacteroidota bacterium]